MFQRIDKDWTPKSGEKWVEAYLSISGWGAVTYWQNPEGFPEPWDTLKVFFDSEALAQYHAYFWALQQALPFNLPGFVSPPDLFQY